MEKIRKENTNKDLVSYCGLYCGACPSYHRATCLGCRSEDNSQKRTSKWNCKIRVCCTMENEILYCGECSEFPCDIISKKLIDSHSGDQRFYYRHEILENVRKIKSNGISNWIDKQIDKWKCNKCGGAITFYDYNCIECDKKYNPKLLNKKGDKIE